MSKVKKLTVAAVLTALTAAILYLAGLFPMVRIAVVAAGGLMTAAAVLQCGIGWGIGVYAASGILSLLLLPDKGAAVWYLLVFGHYAIFKSLIERLNHRVAEWALKTAVFAVTLCGMCFLFRGMFLAALPERGLWLLLIALLACMIVYDIAFSALIHFYCRRIKPHID